MINGSKLFITNGTQADWLCLLARTSDEGGYRGMSQIVVPTDTPGFSVSRKLNKMGNWSSDTAELSFVDMRVPVSNTIGQIGRGFQQQMVQFQDERMIGTYTGVGAMGVATRDVEPYHIVGGIPARTLKIKTIAPEQKVSQEKVAQQKAPPSEARKAK